MPFPMEWSPSVKHRHRCLLYRMQVVSAELLEPSQQMGILNVWRLLRGFLPLHSKLILNLFSLGPQAVEAHSQKFEVKTLSGKLLFSADDNEVVVGAERLRVLGKRLLTKPLF